MLFSYCKRSSSNNYSTVPYQYKMSDLQTTNGFGKTPAYCKSLNVPYVSNRGLPRDLIDKEIEMRGQGRIYQPFCANVAEEGDIQFSMFDWLKDMPLPNKAPIPCVPTPIVQMTPSSGKGSLCNHVGITSRCGSSCACSRECQCKIGNLERNMSRPHVGSMGFRMEPVCNYRF